MQKSKEEMVRYTEGPRGVLAHVRPLQTKGPLRPMLTKKKVLRPLLSKFRK